MKTITLNSVIFLIDLNPEKLASMFAEHELVTSSKILHDLVGSSEERPDLADVVTAEMQHKMLAKLSLG